jgi:anti-sigma B factor antagonist
MQIEEVRQGKAMVLAIEGRLDGAGAHELETRLVALIGAGERSLVVDMGGLAYINSAGLRALLIAAKKLKPEDGRIVLCTMQDQVRDVFEISGFASIFQIFPSRDQAVSIA